MKFHTSIFGERRLLFRGESQGYRPEPSMNDDGRRAEQVPQRDSAEENFAIWKELATRNKYRNLNPYGQNSTTEDVHARLDRELGPDFQRRSSPSYIRAEAHKAGLRASGAVQDDVWDNSFSRLPRDQKLDFDRAVGRREEQSRLQYEGEVAQTKEQLKAGIPLNETVMFKNATPNTIANYFVMVGMHDVTEEKYSRLRADVVRRQGAEQNDKLKPQWEALLTKMDRLYARLQARKPSTLPAKATETVSTETRTVDAPAPTVGIPAPVRDIPLPAAEVRPAATNVTKTAPVGAPVAKTETETVPTDVPADAPRRQKAAKTDTLTPQEKETVVQSGAKLLEEFKKNENPTKSQKEQLRGQLMMAGVDTTAGVDALVKDPTKLAPKEGSQIQVSMNKFLGTLIYFMSIFQDLREQMMGKEDEKKDEKKNEAAPVRAKDVLTREFSAIIDTVNSRIDAFDPADEQSTKDLAGLNALLKESMAAGYKGEGLDISSSYTLASMDGKKYRIRFDDAKKEYVFVEEAGTK